MAVQQLGMVGQGLKAVGKTGRDEQRVAVVGGQMLGMPLQKGGGALAQVHGHIPDLAAQAAHELHLGVRRLLVVHAAHGACEGCVALIDLGDGGCPACARQFIGAEQARKKAALVHQRPALHAEQSRQRQWRQGQSAHGRASQASMSARHSARASAPPCCWRYQFMVRATAVFSDQWGATPSTWRAWAVSSASQPASCGPSLWFS
ncbi:hypothetical protein D3C71_1578690 [compost metagenome]